MHRLLLSCAALLALTLATASAAPGSDFEGTIKTYQRTNASIQAVTEAAIKRFNAKYPKVKVETQWLPLGSWGEYISGFLNQVASGDVPDIYEVAIEGFSSVASRGILIPLDDMIARDASAKSLLDDIDPNLLAGMSRATGGKLYFFPTSWNDVVMFYNKDLFDEFGPALSASRLDLGGVCCDRKDADQDGQERESDPIRLLCAGDKFCAERLVSQQRH